MTPQELMRLSVARIGNDGQPRCRACAPIIGEHAPYWADTEAAPTMVIDPEQPVICTCPGCGAKAVTPWPIAINMLTQQIADLKGVRGEKQSPRFWDAPGGAFVYCKACHKTHAAEPGETPCGGDGSWTEQEGE